MGDLEKLQSEFFFEARKFASNYDVRKVTSNDDTESMESVMRAIEEAFLRGSIFTFDRLTQFITEKQYKIGG